MKLKYTFEMMEIDDETVAVPVGDNASTLHGIVKLNGTGAEILKMIQEEKTESEIVEELGKKYESSHDEIQGFVSEFLKQMAAAGLIA